MLQYCTNFFLFAQVGLILEICGKVIFETSKILIDLTDYETGIYLLKIETKNELINQMIIKE